MAPPGSGQPREPGRGFAEWFGNLSTFGKVRLALFILLLLWLLGVAAPWMLLNLLSGTSLANNAALAAVASLGSYEIVAQNRELAAALAEADSMAVPTATYTPSPTPTSPSDGEVVSTSADSSSSSATPTPAPLLKLYVGQAQVAAAAPAESVAAAAAAPEPKEEVIQAAAVQPARTWDSRLDQLGVRLQEASVGAGQSYWRLVEARWADEIESAGKHHIYVETLNENGNRLEGQSIRVTWGEGSELGITENKAPPDYAYNFQMYAAGYAYTVSVDGAPSDQLSGAGLGSIDQRTYGIHTSYYLTFQRTTKP